MRRAFVAALAGAGVLGAVGALAVATAAERAVAPLESQACGPLHVVDRRGQLLRAVAAPCGHRGRALWVPLAEMPQLLRRMVVVAEDQRFEAHAGVDVQAAARALAQNVAAGRVVSGASTLSMQLMRMLHHPHGARSLANKLDEARLALALETRWSKDAILEAYLNHAYFGRGAYGVGEAAARYFGKTPSALTDSEASLLAVLPRAPEGYDPFTRLPAATQRRAAVLARLAQRGDSSAEQRAQIEGGVLALQQERAPRAFEAPHFVDFVLQSVPVERKRAGGTLETTLDLGLQRKLERAVASHVAALASRGIEQAGVVVLDAQTSEIRAMVGSTSYAHSQLNATVRRRHPGSVLKPFVYALALEAGRSPSSLAYDVGDVASQYATRDWVGHEGGALPLRDALAGSYNLAAVHVLEEVGVAALYSRLRSLGVADAPLTPDRYGLKLALGSTRVRLLDVTAGYGFLVRQGRVRSAWGVRALQQRDGSRLPLDAAHEQQGFAPEVSWLVMDMLSRPENRHGRFGRGLPVEGEAPDGQSARLAAKTGTASGMSDMTTVLATREFLVGSWAGRLDGEAAGGMSGMWSAAPLARLALDIALQGRAPSVPEKPSSVRTQPVCSVSGMPVGPHCPAHAQGYTWDGASEQAPCTWHGEGGALHAPAELEDWLARARASGARGQISR